MRLALVLAAGLALAGCQYIPGAAVLGMSDAQTPAAEPVPAPQPVIKTVVKQVCVPWRKWSDVDLKNLHDALVPVPDGSIIIVALRDWYRYYADAKACSDAQK